MDRFRDYVQLGRQTVSLPLIRSDARCLCRQLARLDHEKHEGRERHAFPDQDAYETRAGFEILRASQQGYGRSNDQQSEKTGDE